MSRRNRRPRCRRSCRVPAAIRAFAPPAEGGSFGSLFAEVESDGTEFAFEGEGCAIFADRSFFVPPDLQAVLRLALERAALVGREDLFARLECDGSVFRKDQVIAESYSYVQGSGSRPACTSVASQSWTNLPPTSLPATSQIQGFRRDNCHWPSASTCPNYGNTGMVNIGDGVWDIAGYKAAHSAVTYPAGLTTRYQGPARCPQLGRRICQPPQ